MYRALYYGKIETQTYYIYIYIYEISTASFFKDCVFLDNLAKDSKMSCFKPFGAAMWSDF